VQLLLLPLDAMTRADLQGALIEISKS
jgi:hypothetical protein